MSTIFRVKSVQPTNTIVQVEFNYANSFCELLKEKKINYSRLDAVIMEKCWEVGITFRQFAWVEITIDYTDDIPNLLLGWKLPSTGC
jgi:hypothetical protein